MKILFLSNSYFPTIGGAQVMLHNLAEALTRMGNHVLVVSEKKEKKGKEFKKNYQKKTIPLPPGVRRTPLRRAYYRIWISMIIRNFKPDVIHIYVVYPVGVWLMPLLKKLKVPLVITCQGIDIQRNASINYGHRLNPILKQQIDAVLSLADSVIAISEDVHKEYAAIPIEENKIHDISNCVNYEYLNAVDKTARARLNIPADAFVIIAVGRNHPKKGFKDLIDIVEALHIKIPLLKCILIGKNNDILWQEIKERKLTKHFIISDVLMPVGLEYKQAINDQPLLVDYLHASNIYVMTSSVEGRPLVALEAVAARLPLVAYAAPGIIDLFENEKTAFLIPNFDKQAFADIILKIYSREKDSIAVQRNADEIAKQFDCRTIGYKHIELYKSLLAKSVTSHIS